MKVSLQWAQRYSNVDLLKEGKARLLERVGSQLGAIDAVEEWGFRYQGIVVVKVVRCETHPHAEKLKICWVDDGGVVKEVNRDPEGLIQIVCGGANARPVMFAAWIPPGVAVPSSLPREPLVLAAREIRGAVSQGMLASPAELSISDEHQGILEVRADDIGRPPQPGEPLKDLFGLDDTVIDIENKMFTHRPDLFGILGVARELAGISGQLFESPGWYRQAPPSAFKPSAAETLPFEVKNRLPELVPRFVAVVISGVEVGPSPYWLQAGLSRVGIRPLNNVVDATNFMMQLTGQPLHAFDYDKLKAKGGPGLVVRMAKAAERLQLLGGKQIALTTDDIVIATGDGPAVALGGIMGGADTEVDAGTRRLVLECATFDMLAIRRTARRHGLFSDAAVRFTKGQSPLQNDRAAAEAVRLINELAGGAVAAPVADLKPAETTPPEAVGLSIDFINSRLGTSLAAVNVTKLLANVECPVDNRDGELSVQPPFWRRDLQIAEDVVEEVGRLYGYDRLPRQLPKRDLTPPRSDPLLSFKHILRQALRAAGANELLTYSFVPDRLLAVAGQKPEEAFRIRNALSPQLQYYRLSLLPSLVEKIHANHKLGFGQFALFELGKTHSKTSLSDDGLPIEAERLALVISADNKSAKNNFEGAAYFAAIRYLDAICREVRLPPLSRAPLPEFNLEKPWPAAAAPLLPSRAAAITGAGDLLGIVGEFNPAVSKQLKLPAYSAGLELDVTKLHQLAGRQAVYQPLNRFPNVTQDLTLSVSAGEPFQVFDAAIRQVLADELSRHGYLSRIQPTDSYKAATGVRHLSWRLTFWHQNRTLTNEEVNDLLKRLVSGVSQFGATRVE